jgi:predicted metal-dependent phosphotriesterase family hydrolase
MSLELQQIAGSGGSHLYVGAGTYKTSDGTLYEDTRSIYIRADQSAMITSMKVNGTSITRGIVGADLKANDFFTFEKAITEIVIAGGSFIGYSTIND